jgi:hypothetical protein
MCFGKWNSKWNSVWKRFERLSKAAVFEMFFDHLAFVQFIRTLIGA